MKTKNLQVRATPQTLSTRKTEENYAKASHTKITQDWW